MSKKSLCYGCKKPTKNGRLTALVFAKYQNGDFATERVDVPYLDNTPKIMCEECLNAFLKETKQKFSKKIRDSITIMPVFQEVK